MRRIGRETPVSRAVSFIKQKRGDTRIILLFSILAVILVLAGAFLFIKGITPTDLTENTALPFKVDQILIKVLIKDDESMVRPINIMNICEEDLVIEIEPQYLLDIIGISEKRFTLKPGQTKTAYLNFSSSIKEEGIRQKPGVYVGNLLTKSNSNVIETPVIVEIETKDVLFDANIEVPIRQKEIKQGDYLEVQATFFNLKNTGLTNLNADYFVKDTAGNTIITESESITIETQASFIKTVHIPENLNPGEYVFGAVIGYGSSVGTSTFSFEVIKPAAEEKTSFDYCRNSPFCWVGLITLAIIMLIIISYMHFLIGAFVHGKLHPKSQKNEISTKKKRLFERLGLWMKRRKAERLNNKIRASKEKKKIQKEMAETKTAEKWAKERKAIEKKEVRIKAFKKLNKDVKQHRKGLWLLSILAVLVLVICYLFYSKVVSLAKISNFWALAAGWLKSIAEKCLSYIRNAWSSGSYYASPERAYFYPVLAVIIGLAVLAAFAVAAKKKHLFQRLGLWMKRRGLERLNKKIKASREKKRIQKERVGLFDKLKKAIQHHKVMFWFLLGLVICSIAWAIMFYLGFFSGLTSKFADIDVYPVQRMWNESVLFIGAYRKHIVNFLITALIILIAFSMFREYKKKRLYRK